jgi:hypothetical protein
MYRNFSDEKLKPKLDLWVNEIEYTFWLKKTGPKM